MQRSKVTYLPKARQEQAATFRIDQDVMSQYHTAPKCQCVNETKTRFFLKGHVHHGWQGSLLHSVPGDPRQRRPHHHGAARPGIMSSCCYGEEPAGRAPAITCFGLEVTCYLCL